MIPLPSASRPRGNSGILFCSLLLTLSVLGLSARAHAECLSNPDPAIAKLEALVNQDATKALAGAQAALEDAEHARHPDPGHLAALYAVQAQGYSALELDGDARKAALKGLELAPNENDPLHLTLETAYAENVYDKAGIDGALQKIETLRSAQIPGSLTDTCLLITQGRLQYRQDHPDLAILSLTKAYRASLAPARAEQRALSAEILSSVMRGMTDYAQALALNQEVIDWDTAHGATLNLSVTRFLRGSTYMAMRDYPAALVAFTQARNLSVLLRDQQGIAFADLNTCEAHIELGQLDLAKPECENARGVFLASHSTDVIKDADGLLARIDLAQGRTERALATLNGVLDQAGTDLTPRRVATLYELRARTNATLHNYREAYADLEEYVKRYVSVSDAERNRQAVALRVRFETDREIERNASLKRELMAANERSKRQKELLRWTAIAFAAGAAAMAFLSYILITNFRHRRQLIELANHDGLTGLPNRRHTRELATAALVNATAEKTPLTVAVIDLDHFKAVNDRFGHMAGDHVLKEFARRSRECLRGKDLLGRWGGEEFLLVMPDTPLELALPILERLRTMTLGIPLPGSNTNFSVSLSAGLATFDASTKSLDDIIARADAALYKAKDQGRDLVRIDDENYRTASTAVRRAVGSGLLI